MDTILQGNGFILWEGDRGTQNPLIECIPEGEIPLFTDDERLIAAGSEGDFPDKPEHFRLTNAKHLCDWIINTFNLDERIAEYQSDI